MLQHLKNLQNTLKNQIQDIERTIIFQNNEFNIYPDECSSKIQYTDILKKLKYITTIHFIHILYYISFIILLQLVVKNEL